MDKYNWDEHNHPEAYEGMPCGEVGEKCIFIIRAEMIADIKADVARRKN
jgi:hypothetical protein